MKKNFIYIILIIFLLSACGTTRDAINTPIANQKTKDAGGADMLLGHCSGSCLHEWPYKEWFEKNYAGYAVDTASLYPLKAFLADKTIVVFMGTWCGDSRREVPALMKILDHCNISGERLQLIMLDYQDGAYKQSPGHEEKDKQIFRVPCIIVMSGKKEAGRIVESPRKTLEKDLLDINAGNYQPNYAAGKWFFEKLEKSPIKRLYRDSSAIIKKIKPQLKNSAELNSIGHVLTDRGDKGKAIFTFLINTDMYPSSITAYNGLANAYIQNNEKEKARIVVEKATRIDANNEETKRLSKLLE
jgi:tetratricopeptide (TPR) repeat protein